MPVLYVGLQLWIALVGRFDKHQVLGVLARLALPHVNGLHLGEDIHAGCKPGLYQVLGKMLSGIQIRHRSQYQYMCTHVRILRRTSVITFLKADRIACPHPAADAACPILHNTFNAIILAY